jgi:Domain of unknown function (DUF4386)
MSTYRRASNDSPQPAARTAGMLWLVCIVTSIVGFVATNGLIVRDDAAMTATNIMANEWLFRLGFVANLVSGISYLGVTALLYHVLKPAGRSLSFAAAVFGAAGVAVGGVAFLAHIAPLLLLSGNQYLAVFPAIQLQALALLALKLETQVFSVGMVFFGIQCLLAGCLIVRSTFLPRVLGALLASGGVSYVIVSLAGFLAPRSDARLLPLVMPIALLGEGSLTAWLLAKGIDVDRWRQQAIAHGELTGRGELASSAGRVQVVVAARTPTAAPSPQ